MSDTSPPEERPRAAPVRLVEWIIGTFDCIPYWIVALAARVFPAIVFFQFGRSLVAGRRITDAAITLFQTEYRLPLIDPTIMANITAVALFLFPVLLVIGLAARFAAVALLVMTAVIEYVHPAAWPTHGVWAACFLLVIAGGPGALSLDELIARRLG